jgi:hypothetical protein
MSPYRFAAKLLLTAPLLWICACDTSTGSLINEDVQDLLHPLDENLGSTFDEPTGDNDSPKPTSAAALPLVTSVSPTITISGTDIVLLIHGENLSGSLSVQLDNDDEQCQVSELGNTTSGVVRTNLIEAACATRGISNRVLSVTDASGHEVAGSPITFTGTSITVSTTSRVSNSQSKSNFSQATASTHEDSPTPSNPFAVASVATADPARVVQSTLSAPTNLRRVESTEFINLAWDAVERAQGYSVYVSDATNPQPGVRGTTTYISYTPSIQITDVDSDRAQYIVVQAFANNIESVGSAELQVNIQATLRTLYAVQTQISKHGDTLANQEVRLSDKPTRSVDQSSDGRFTVFLSRANNLVLTPTSGHVHVYLHDRHTGVVKLVSQSSTGSAGNADSSSPKISADGHNIVFVSTASNLDEQVTIVSGVSNVFTRNLVTGETRILSVSALVSNVSANANSFDPVIDANGENIVYSSYASDLTTAIKSQTSHIFHFNSSNNTTNVILTARNTLSASYEYSLASASAISASGEFIFYRLDVPMGAIDVHRQAQDGANQSH